MVRCRSSVHGATTDSSGQMKSQRYPNEAAEPDGIVGGREVSDVGRGPYFTSFMILLRLGRVGEGPQ
jgi:hypothetical protein